MMLSNCCCGDSQTVLGNCCNGRIFPPLNLTISGTIGSIAGSITVPLVQIPPQLLFGQGAKSFAIFSQVPFDNRNQGANDPQPPVPGALIFAEFAVHYTNFFGFPVTGRARIYFAGASFGCSREAIPLRNNDPSPSGGSGSNLGFGGGAIGGPLDTSVFAALAFWVEAPDIDGFLTNQLISNDNTGISSANLLSCNPLHITGHIETFFPNSDGSGIAKPGMNLGVEVTE